MTTVSTQVNENYQIILPEEVRRVLKLQPNDTLIFLIHEETVLIRPKPMNFTQTLRGLHKEVWPIDAEQALAEERDTWE